MVVPGMYDLPKVIALSGRTEEELFDCGITGELVFLVVVPELGACRVPDVALSHFMAGADVFTANAMPEHWTKALSGEWTIKRERLRILADSWDRFSLNFHELIAALGGDPDASITQAALTHLKSLPPSEAKRWEAADRQADGRRIVTSQQAGLSSTCLMTLEQFNDEVLTRLLRWRSGRYMVYEAAQILADANPDTVATPGINAEKLCKQMEEAIHAGKLTIRLNGLPVANTSITEYRLYLHTVLQSDVNEWLIERRAGYALTYPYESSAPATGDDLVTPPVPPALPVGAGEIDFTMVATRSQLIDAFGGMTKMNFTWFDNLTDAPKLMAARKFKGQGGRNSAEPLFCPFEVMQWLVDPQRRKGKAIRDTTAWRLLKGHFPKVYNRYSIGDPNAD